MSIELNAALAVAKQAALDVAPSLKAGFGASAVVQEKSHNPWDTVTQLDRDTEERLAESLGKFDPGVPFRGEEFGGDVDADTTWLVDPIDGTTHFVRGLPFCTTMIALVDRGEVVVSVISDFVSGALYTAARGGGAHCNDQRIHMADRSLNESYFAIEINLDIGNNSEILQRINGHSPLLNFACCGWPFGASAIGKLDGRFSKDPWGKDWDFAPGSLLIEEAGGVVTNLGSDTYDYRDHDFIATSPRLHDELSALIETAL